jgi:regulator of protease activity HflC (stomatin/prohibitin superfamily)
MSLPSEGTVKKVAVGAATLGGLYYGLKFAKGTAQRCMHFLDQDEQLIVVGLTETAAQNGPGIRIVSPMVKSVEKRKAVLLEAMDYAKVKDSLQGNVRVERGPKLLFLQPYDQVVQKGKGNSMSPVEYCIVLDKITGKKRMEKGPQVLFPGAFEEISAVMSAIALEANQYCIVVDTATGKKWTQKGEYLLFCEPTWEVSQGVQSAVTLKRTEYVRLEDKNTGKIRVERGEQMVFPTPFESLLDGKKSTSINLKVFEYVKILDSFTGEVRVERGEKVVFLGATEAVLDNGKKLAIEVDEQTAVRIRNKQSGKIQLLTDKGLFMPQPQEEIMEVQQLLVLMDYEAVILKDAHGQFTFFYGDDTKRGDKPRSFFVPPYHELNTLTWSKGRRRDARSLRIQKIDCRPQFMNFEFNCRTNDNVELILEGTFFWEISDVEQMVKITGDTTGDICSHARSRFIQLVAKVTLKQFMNDFNNIAKQAHENDDNFYVQRGVKIHSLEVTRYQCADQSTAQILEQIIQETTNRMNRLQQQESANEVGIFQLQGEIEQEKLKTDFITVRQTHKCMEATGTADAEAQRVNVFMKKVAEEVPDLPGRIGLWNTLRKQDALEAVSSGSARIYFTPNDCNLSIQTKETD